MQQPAENNAPAYFCVLHWLVKEWKTKLRILEEDLFHIPAIFKRPKIENTAISDNI